MSNTPIADAFANAEQDAESEQKTGALPDMLSLFGFGNVLCQPTTADLTLGAVWMAMHELASGKHTLH